ncbi:DnaJ domain-containing protein [Aspergillus varians]
MPLPRRPGTPIFQFLFDNPHCHQAFPHDHICSPTSNAHSHGHRHSHGHTHKAPFSTTKRLQYLDSPREPNYYEVLDVPVTATTSEIKKKFYSLSLSHHPDRNPDDPSASSRFAKISSAYQVLSNSTKRSTYDRDHGVHSHSFQSTHSTATPGQHPMGSHSSHSSHASYFGSRPASGLSKRRGVFRGPPPSFYAHGGYGKRSAPSGPEGSYSASPGGSSSRAAGSAGRDDEDPTSFIDRNPLSHFNARGHYRTQTAEDARRRERRERHSRSHADINEQYIGSRGDFVVRFIVVSSILVGAGVVGGFFRWPGS